MRQHGPTTDGVRLERSFPDGLQHTGRRQIVTQSLEVVDDVEVEISHARDHGQVDRPTVGDHGCGVDLVIEVRHADQLFDVVHESHVSQIDTPKQHLAVERDQAIPGGVRTVAAGRAVLADRIGVCPLGEESDEWIETAAGRFLVEHVAVIGAILHVGGRLLEIEPLAKPRIVRIGPQHANRSTSSHRGREGGVKGLEQERARIRLCGELIRVGQANQVAEIGVDQERIAGPNGEGRENGCKSIEGRAGV